MTVESAANRAEATSRAPATGADKLVATRSRPPEMVAEAMRLPNGSALTGQPVTLLNALTSTQDRRQQLEVTRVYWRLVQGVADYHFCMDHVQNLDRTRRLGSEPTSLRLAQASAVVRLRQAELDATTVQYELARWMRLPAGAALPLPADRPHVGAYRTNFQELFAGRTPPEPTALIDRILPIRRQSIDDQAAAVQAAEDALAAVGELSTGDAAVTCSQELLRQQMAFIRIVCEYNRNIAEYGLAVAGPTASPQVLVATLIGPVQQGVVPTIPGDVRQTATNQPTAAPPLVGWRTGQPTLAPPRDAMRKNEPTLAPPRDSAIRRLSNEEPTLAPTRDQLQPVGKDEPTLAPPRDEVNKQPASLEDMPLVPIDRQRSSPHPLAEEESQNNSPRPGTTKRSAGEGQGVRVVDAKSASPRANTKPKQSDGVKKRPDQTPAPAAEQAAESRTAKKPVADSNSQETPGKNGIIAATSALYPALVNAAPTERAKQLTVALHGDRLLPSGAGKPISLADCLVRDPNADHRATIEVYWRLRQRAAEYQVLVQQAELLEGLASVVLERRREASGPSDMLWLHTVQRATQASIREANAALVEAQYALALRIGLQGESIWPLASTIPHSGSYLLMLDARPQNVVQSWSVRRLATTIPALGQSIQQRAAAVVEADQARVAAMEKYGVGVLPIDRAIAAITAQTQETLTLLASLTDYNRTIAEYVLIVMPPAMPVHKLVTALVIKP